MVVTLKPVACEGHPTQKQGLRICVSITAETCSQSMKSFQLLYQGFMASVKACSCVKINWSMEGDCKKVLELIIELTDFNSCKRLPQLKDQQLLHLEYICYVSCILLLKFCLALMNQKFRNNASHFELSMYESITSV